MAHQQDDDYDDDGGADADDADADAVVGWRPILAAFAVEIFTTESNCAASANKPICKNIIQMWRATNFKITVRFWGENKR